MSIIGTHILNVDCCIKFKDLVLGLTTVGWIERGRERRKYSAGRIGIRLLLGGFVLIINIYVIYNCRISNICQICTCGSQIYMCITKISRQCNPSTFPSTRFVGLS